MNKPIQQEFTGILPPENDGDRKRRQFKGVRMRKWGKWVSEVRMPNSRAKIWLGSYETAEQAALAFDAAIFCLRGPHAIFNFPDAVPAIPSAQSLSRQQIQLAAAKYARGQLSFTCRNNLAGKPLSQPPISSTLSEMEALSESLLISEDLNFVLGESLLSDGNQLLNLDNILSDEGITSELTSSAGEQGSMFFDVSQLWDF